MARMADGRQYRNSERREYRKNSRRNAYISGTAVRKLDVVTEINKPQQPRELSHAVRKNRDKAVYMNLGYVLFLSASLLVAGFVLIGYIRLQSEITSSVKRISSMESALNSLKVANDEEYSRITSNINLEEIKRIAIGELGMTYATEGQVIPYESDSNDYMRQADNSQN